MTCLRAWPPFRALSPCSGPCVPSSRGVRPLPSLPADVHPRVHSRARRPFGRSLPDDRSRSVFAVSHRLDGLLLRGWCGPVASRCRAEGSPRFPLLHGPIRGSFRDLAFPATRFTPPEGPPSSAAVAASPRSLALLPSSSVPSAPPTRPRVPITEVTGRFPLRATPRGHDRGAARENGEPPSFTVGPARCRRPPRRPSRASGTPVLPCGILEAPAHSLARVTLQPPDSGSHLRSSQPCGGDLPRCVPISESCRASGTSPVERSVSGVRLSARCHAGNSTLRKPESIPRDGLGGPLFLRPDAPVTRKPPPHQASVRGFPRPPPKRAPETVRRSDELRRAVPSSRPETARQACKTCLPTPGASFAADASFRCRNAEPDANRQDDLLQGLAPPTSP